jgi:hypothetical protein
LVVSNETTAITLHTDGYFNDRSPAAEKNKIEKTLKELEKKPNVLVNCVAYGNYTDFSYLSSIANRMSGACVVAQNVKQVYEALHNTSALLAGRVTPAIPVSIEGADWQVALNLSQRKVNGSASDLIVRGVGPDDELRVFRFSKVNEATFEKSPEVEGNDPLVLASFARTKLAEGKINEAKYAIVSMRSSSFLQKHYNAISADRLMALSQDLDAIIGGDLQIETSETYGFEAGRPLTELFRLLNDDTKGFALHLSKLLDGYQRRSIKKLNGKFDESGTFVPNAVELVEAVELTEDPWVGVTGFDINTSEATINMTTIRDAELLKDGKRVNRIGATKLDLSLLRQYTIVGDGSVLVPNLTVMFSSKGLFDRVKAAGFLSADAEFSGEHTIPLSQFPVVPLEATSLQPPTYDELLVYGHALVAEKILKAVLPAEAKSTHNWTPEQAEELKSFGLTPTLFFSAPSTVPYTDRDKAIAEGLIDNYTRYTVSFGTEHASDIRTALWSANEMLQRYYEVDAIKKPKFSDLASAKSITQKVIKKPVLLDSLAWPVVESYVEQKVWEWPVDRIKAELATLDRSIESRLSALALSIGSTGLIPENWNMEIFTAEQLESKHATMDIPKAHAEGSFFGANGAYIGVHAEIAWYSTEKGLTEAEKIGA